MRRTLFVTLMIAALLLAACGSTPEPTQAPEATQAPQATQAPAAEPTQAPAGLSGKLSLAGSTTVQPLAEVLAEAFMEMYPDVVIEIQGGGSSVGVTSAGEGTVDIGNASRAIKDSEFQQFPDLQVFTIAYDGIAIVTNPGLVLPTLSVDQVASIFAGEITNFSEVGGPDAPITVVSREEGSGTRAAFEELVMASGDEEKLITEKALLQQSNGQVRTTVATTPNTIGYLSFGFLDESIAATPIDGVAPRPDNVKNGSYPIFRPLNMLTKGAPNELAQAFLDYILGDAGQEIVAEDYITVTASGGGGEPAAPEPTKAPEPTAAPAAGGAEGSLSLAGSTTVQPLAEVLAEAYMEMHPDVVIEIQSGGSSVGVTSAGEGTVDIGNASRAIKSSEFEQFPDLQVFTIARDGIAIVTNPGIELPSLTVEQVRNIFAGEITNFSEVGGPDAPITVVSREEGSGTRAAFEELVMAYKDEAGESQEKVITEKALLQQSNGQVRTTIATTPNTIGFLSFGFLDDSTRGVAINHALPLVVNVTAGSYPIARPLNMLTKGAPNALAQAFLDYILSEAGQEIVAEDYIPVLYTPLTGLSGSLSLAGSTTVQPLAEVLAEAFMELNPDVVIEIQGGGSSVGVTSAGEGTTDIGNASRAIKDSEFEQFPDLQVFTIARDGIAIVTNPGVQLPSLTVEQVRDIFAGEITNFSEVGGPDAPITVVSREEGSGTRAAFEELVMAYKDAAGESQEKLITENALLQQSNGQVRTTVATTPNTIGFLSFGFLDESVAAVSINDVEPIVENVKNDTYPIARPLNMLTKGAPNELATAFLEYILSDLGQEIVAEDYISIK
jgi:phosphate transport system substrate-binding protein